MLIAIGTIGLWGVLHRWAAHRSPSWDRTVSLGLVAILGIGFVYSGIRTYRDYFVTWGSDPDLFTHFETGQSAIGSYIKGRPDEERIYTSPVSASHHSVALNSEQRQGVKSYNGQFCMVVPQRPEQDTTYIVVPDWDETSLDLLQQYFPQGKIADEGPLHYQLPFFLSYLVPAGAEAQVLPAQRLTANWDNEIQLLGYDLDHPTYRPGDTVRLTLYYGGLSRMDSDYTAFVHLVGPHNPASAGPCSDPRNLDTWVSEVS